LIRSPENLGNAGGIKLAMEYAFSQGFDGVWILDDDSWPEADAFEKLIDPAGPPRGIRTSLVLAPESSEVSWPCEIMEGSGRWKTLERLEPIEKLAWIRVRRSWLGSLLTKSAYDCVGPVNSDLFLRGEDEDYPRALEAAGYRFWMTPRSILRHPVAGPLVMLSLGDNKLCLERNLGGDKLYYRIRNTLWIKNRESGFLVTGVLACGYLLLVLRWFRPLLPALKIFTEATIDAMNGRLGKRISSQST
jgi:hypothetical protein